MSDMVSSKETSKYNDINYERVQSYAMIIWRAAPLEIARENPMFIPVVPSFHLNLMAVQLIVVLLIDTPEL